MAKTFIASKSWLRRLAEPFSVTPQIKNKKSQKKTVKIFLVSRFLLKNLCKNDSSAMRCKPLKM